MKKTFLMMLVAAGLLAVSCEKSFDDGGGSATDRTAKVSVNLGFPKMQTRAYSDGTTATHLQYTVYEVDKTGKIIQQLASYTETEETINISKQIDFQLVTGRYYTFVFWAAAPSEKDGWQNPYIVNLGETGATMSVTYDASATATATNDERLDAFFASVPVKQITGDVEMTVELTRPFAQINVGTSDLEVATEMNAAPNRSYIYVTNAYTQLDLVSGEVLGEASKIRLALGQIPGSTYNDNTKAAETFPVAGYDYLAMAYILANAEQEVVDVQFGYIKDAVTTTMVQRTVGSVPIQRNHRTNLFGEVLTSNASLNIIIKPEYEEPDYNYDQLLFAAAVGGSSTLTDNVEVPGELTFTKDAVVDLGGHEIKAEGGTYGDAIVIGNGANVTLKNGTIKQAEKATAEAASAVIYVTFSKTSPKASTLTLEEMTVEGFRPIYLNNPTEGTTVTIKSGTYTCTGTSGEAVYVQKGGKVIIEGGTFSNPNADTEKGYNKFLLNVLGKLLTETGKTSRDFIEVRGGTFIGFNPAANEADGNPTNYVADGYKSVETAEGSNTWVVIPEETTVANGSQSLYNAIKSGATSIILTPGEHTFTTPMYDSGNQRFTTDLSPKVTIDATGATFVGMYSPNFHGATVKGATFKNSENEKAIFGSFQGTFIDCVFDGGMYTESKGNKSSFQNCKFICDAAKTGRMAFHNGLLDHDNTITLTNCEIDGRCDFGDDGTIEFKNCKIHVTQSWGLYGNITCDFTGSTITYEDGATIEKKSETAKIIGLE